MCLADPFAFQLKILGALATCRIQPQAAYLQQHVARIQTRLDKYNAANLHLLLGSLADLGYLPSRELIAAWLSHARPQLRYFGPQVRGIPPNLIHICSDTH